MMLKTRSAHSCISIVLTFGVIFIVAGCTAFVPEKVNGSNGPPVAAPENARQSVNPSDLSGLSLDRSIEIALANNPALAAAARDADAALARTSAARGARLPQIAGVAGYARHLDEQRLIPASSNGDPGVFGDDLFYGDLVLRIPLYTGGRLLNAVRAADLLRMSAEFRAARTREELIFNVSSVFYGILAQQRLIDSLAFSQNALEGHLKRINDMIDAQKAAPVDRLRTEVRLSDVRQKLLRETNGLRIRQRLLATLMGIGLDGAMIGISGRLEEAMPEAAPLDTLMKTALEQRPDYQAVRRDLEARARLVDIARAGYLPDVNLLGAYGMRWAADPEEEPPGTHDAEDLGRIGIQVEVPLFTGGQIRARVREERANLDAARQRLRHLELNVRLEVETAHLNMTSAFERVRTTEKTVEQARESLRIEREKYELGRGAILDVLDAQAALLESETNYYQALADINIAIADLGLATGELFK